MVTGTLIKNLDTVSAALSTDYLPAIRDPSGTNTPIGLTAAQIAALTDTSGFVPYTGATGNVDIGTNILYAGTAIFGATSASQLVATDSLNSLTSLSTITYPNLTEISYVKGVTSSIQTQLGNKQATGNYITALTGEVTASGPGSSAATLANSAVIGKVLTGFSPGAGTVSSADTILQAFNKIVGNIAAIISGVTSVFGRSGAVTAQAGDYNTSQVTESSSLYFTDERAQDAVGSIVDGSLVYDDVTPSLSRAAITGDITISAGSNTAAITSGVIVNADVNASAAISLSKLATTTASRAVVTDASGFLTAGTTTSTEIGFVNGVTSAIQTQIDGKQATITGAATTITSSNLTANRALLSNASGKVAISTVTDAELGYVSGVTSAIQTQLNSKQATGNYITALTGDATASGPGSAALTLATVNASPGTFGSGNGIPVVTVNGKGLVTGASTTSVNITTGNISDIASVAKTFLISPSSASLANAVTDETGTGALVFGTSPTFTTQITAPTVHGSAAAGGSLTLSSTSNATKGKVILGSLSAYDEASDLLGIGTTSPDTYLQVAKTQSSGTSINMFKAGFDANWNLRLVQNYAGAGDIKYEWKQVYSSAEYDVLAFKTGNTGIGTASPNYKTHVVKTATNGDVTTARQLAIGVDNSTSYNMSFGYYFDGAVFSGVIQARDNNTGSTLYLNPSGGGVVVGAPTGGSQGTGTINAKAVYDDGVLLTCYPLEKYITGEIDLKRWDAVVPPREIVETHIVPVLDENGDQLIIEGSPATEEKQVVVGTVPQTHTPAHGFVEKMKRVDLLDIDAYVDDWMNSGSLSAFYGFEAEKKPTGESIQRIMETLDIFAVHIKKLNDRVKELEAGN